MRPGAEVWVRAQPKTAAAIRAVWNGHATGEQRELFNTWIRTRIIEGLTVGVGARDLLADVKGRKGVRGERHVKPEGLHQAPRMIEQRIPVPDVASCWFPYCPRGLHHRGQHGGIAKAGQELNRIRRLAQTTRDQASPEVERCELAKLLLDEILR